QKADPADAGQRGERVDQRADDAADPAGLGGPVALGVHLVGLDLLQVAVAADPGGQSQDGADGETGDEDRDEAEDPQEQDHGAAVRLGVAAALAELARVILVLVVAAAGGAVVPVPAAVPVAVALPLAVPPVGAARRGRWGRRALRGGLFFLGDLQLDRAGQA